MQDEIAVFDRTAVRRHRDRAAVGFAAHDFLFREVAARLVDRLDDITRRFPRAADLGAHDGTIARTLGRRGGVETLVQCDLSAAMAAAAARQGGTALVADEEALPFAHRSLDLVLSNLSLHWVNDLPGALLQIARALRPDGLFLAAMFGGQTLRELREALLEAEAEQEGGVSPRVSPFVDAREAGHLLQRAGFALPVVDVDMIPVTYPDALALWRDLRGMGESNALNERRRRGSRRSTLLRAAALYGERFAEPDGRVRATFEIVYLTAWAPAPTQQKPLAPGSAQARLADALGTTERPAGDKARPK